MNADSLKRIAAKQKIPFGTVEKDYVITIILALISEMQASNLMAFKGGTAIKKIYFPDARFSEDLDFTCHVSKEVTKIIEQLAALIKGKTVLGIGFKDAETLNVDSYSVKGRVQYYDANGHLNSVRIDLSVREEPAKKTSLIKVPDEYKVGNELTCSYARLFLPVIFPLPRTFSCELNHKSFSNKNSCLNCRHFLYDDAIKRSQEEIDFYIRTMSREEILAEKVRALLARKMPRDLHDIWFLLNKNVSLDLKLVDRKLRYYELKFDLNEFIKAIDEMKSNWERDLKPLLFTVEEFDKVKGFVVQKFEVAK